MAHSSEIGVGTVLAETYEIVELLGEGGMGAVWAAKHLRLPGKRVAVKVLHGVVDAAGTSGASKIDRESYARFRREAEIATKIGHPNIVQVHDFNVLPSGTPYLVLEFLDGEDLAHRLQRGTLPLDQTLALTRQIGAALQAAHKHDVVHRDLKPGNIFLVPTEIGGEIVDQVKVLDFGISKIRGSQTVQTQESAMLGTPQYMAPEQALGKNSQIDARTDVFAFGAIVYEMLSGQAPFAGNTLAAVVYKVVFEPTTPLHEVAPSVPLPISQAVGQAMAKDAGQRFGDVAAFVTALTGRPLQTLDRMKARNATAEAMASTQAAPSVPPALQTTGARGEVAQVVPPTATPAVGAADARPATGAGATASGGAGNNKWIFAAAAALVLAAGGFGLLRALHSEGPATTGPSAATGTTSPSGTTGTTARTEPTAPSGTTATPAGEKPDPDDEETPEPPTGEKDRAQLAALAKMAVAQSKQLAKHDGTGAITHEEALPPEVAGELTGAEALIASNPTEAVRLARHTLVQQKSSRAYSIITRAFCTLGDLGNANANLHNVSGAERARVVRACKAAGTDLQ